MRSAAPEQVVDWAVHMRRLSEESRADHRLLHGALELEDIDLLARRIATFTKRRAAMRRLRRTEPPR